MKIRMFVAPALLLAVFAFNADAQIRWTWSFGTESGYFVTDGTLVNGAAPAATYNVRDFAVSESQIPDQLGSMRDGQYTEHRQPNTGFKWDGTRDTQWFRSGGRATNGANYYTLDLNTMYTFAPGYYYLEHNFSQRLLANVITLTPGPNAEISSRGVASPGGVVNFNLHAWDQARKSYVLATSLGRGPIPIGTRKLYLSVDPMFLTSAFGFAPAIFGNYNGTFDRAGQATANLAIANEQALVGLELHTAYIVLDPNAPDGVSAISETETITIQ